MMELRVRSLAETHAVAAALAGLARDTEGIGLGSMVSPVTFRIPGSYAKVVATVIALGRMRWTAPWSTASAMRPLSPVKSRMSLRREP